jgi:NAD(P)-dependent dehydrogenase (short-subunit alcohol dehydrogenase family)
MNVARIANGKVALITGGGKGIRQAIAGLAFADGIAPLPPTEEVADECIEELYAIWHYAPNLALDFTTRS